MSPLATRAACIAILLALPFLAGAANEDEKKAPAPAAEGAPPAPQSASPITPPITVKLLEPGAEPRRPLRYPVQPGKKETLAVEVRMTMAMEMGAFKPPENAMPPIRLTYMLDPREASPQGDVRVEFRVEAAEVLASPEAAPFIVSSLKGQIEALKGITGRGWISPQGAPREVVIDAPKGGTSRPPNLDQVRQTFLGLTVPLPAEPVRKGARWEASMPLPGQTLQGTQTIAYTLASLDGEKVSLELTLRQEAPPQKFQPPGAPAAADLQAFQSKGSGASTIDLASLVAQGELKSETIMDLSVSAGGAPQQLKNILRTETRTSAGGTPLPASGEKKDAPPAEEKK